MISSLLRLASVVCIAVLVISFGGFVSDEASHSSKQTVATIASADDSGVGNAPARTTVDVNQPAPDRNVERAREREHSPIRERVDDANDLLVAPFKGVASGSIWTQRIVSGLLALLVFGLGLGFLGRYAATRGV